MATLSIPVERLREGPLELEINVSPDALDLQDEDFKFTGRVTGEVVFQIVGNDVLGTGKLRGHIEGVCVRCLAPARVDLNVPVNEVWVHNKPETEPVDREFSEDAPLTRTYSGDEIELDEPFRELVMAELPDRVFCQEACKGLCPGCGANLNEEECRCAPEQKGAGREERIPEWKQTLKNIKLNP